MVDFVPIAIFGLQSVLLEFALEAILARSIVLGAALPGWITLAGILHVMGMLELYESTVWWDHLTHAVSAGFVAALAYAGSIVTVRSVPGLDPRAVGIAAFTVGVTFVVGVAWELAELIARDIAQHYDVEPVLVHYGWRDTAYDLVFDVVGALAVVVLDLRAFVPLLEQLPRATGAMLPASGVILLGSTLVVGLYVASPGVGQS